ncbi:MAG: hypothetical protein H6722_29535 [Sandaracinus sp.]|nr:hypothetical protein [Sandaracinus sp.]
MRWVLIAATLGGLGLGSYAAWEERELRVEAPVPEALAREAMAREVAVAEALGFEPAEQTELDLPSTFGQLGAFPVTVEAGECVAAVGGYWGWQRVSSFAIATRCDTQRDSRLSEQSRIHGAALHVQWCSDVATTLQVCAQSGAPDRRWDEHEAGPRPMALQILRAPEARVRGRENRGFALR